MEVVRPVPTVFLLGDVRASYKGRARATGSGGALLVLLKSDGSVVGHSLSGGIKPVFYNPPGRVALRRKGSWLTIASVSTTQERLVIEGEVLAEWAAPTQRAAQKILSYRNGLERDLAEWLRSNPGVLGLTRADLAEAETVIGSGRVDFLVRRKRMVIEVKRHATMRTYDQIARYLRAPHVRRVIVVCLTATSAFEQAVRGQKHMKVVKVSAMKDKTGGR